MCNSGDNDASFDENYNVSLKLFFQKGKVLELFPGGALINPFSEQASSIDPASLYSFIRLGVIRKGIIYYG